MIFAHVRSSDHMGKILYYDYFHVFKQQFRENTYSKNCTDKNEHIFGRDIEQEKGI